MLLYIYLSNYLQTIYLINLTHFQCAGHHFINKIKLLNAMGVPKWLIPSRRKKSKLSKYVHNTNDVFNLDYLLNQVMKGKCNLI